MSEKLQEVRKIVSQYLMADKTSNDRRNIVLGKLNQMGAARLTDLSDEQAVEMAEYIKSLEV